MNVVAFGITIEEARAKAYGAINNIKFDQMQFRRDIGAKAIKTVVKEK